METFQNMRIQEPNPNSSQNPKVKYLLTLPFRIVIACCLLFISFVIMLGFSFHYRNAKVAKAHGEEIKVVVLRQVSPRNSRERQYYILQSPNRGSFTHYSHAKYPVGKSINMLYLNRSEVPPSSLAASDILIRGRKSDSFLSLYFSSVKDKFMDYGITHSLCSFISGILAIKVVLPPANKSKSK
ncbi:hypothetical protein [Nodularia spumigena]|uniref:hypothetical protein n=1 Tax=Nodularia spumigena TaxID=70799 RepID=UPI000D315AD1|nr:hypothetical protein [Nodularia spumigena]